jgi:hypothetical protein
MTERKARTTATTEADPCGMTARKAKAKARTRARAKITALVMRAVAWFVPH